MGRWRADLSRAGRPGFAGALGTVLLLLALGLAGGSEIADPEPAGSFRIEKIRRDSGRYLILEDGRVRLPGGETGVLEREDSEWLWVRVAEAPPFVLRAPAEETRPLDDPAAAPLPEVDRLRLESFDRGLPRSGQCRNGFDLADLDGDGHLDLVHGPPRKASRPLPVVFLGDGAGSWHPWSEARFPPLRYDYGTVAVGDLDGDGRADLVLAMHLLGIEVLRGDGSGSFEPWGRGISPTDGSDPDRFTSVAVRIADWDGDGRSDIIAVGEGPGSAPATGSGRLPESRGVRVYTSHGDGTWTVTSPEQGELGRDFGADLALADLNGDGREDLVIGSRRLGNRQIIGLRGAGGSLTATTVEALPTAALAEAVEAADVDGDGRTDLVIGFRQSGTAGWTTGLVLHFGGPEGLRKPGRRVAEWLGEAGVRSLAVGDLDGDGFADVAAGTGDGEIRLLLGDGTGSFSPEAASELPPSRPGCAVYDLQLADLDGDSRDELIAGYAGEPEGSMIRAPDRSGCSRQGSLRAWKPVLLLGGPAAFETVGGSEGPLEEPEIRENRR